MAIRHLIWILIASTFVLPCTGARAALVDVLRNSPAMRAALLETRQGSELLSLTLGRPVAPFSATTRGPKGSQVLNEALARWRSPSTPGGRAVEERLESVLRRLSEDSELSLLETRLKSSGLSVAERQAAERELGARLDARIKRLGGFGIEQVPQSREFFGHQPLDRASFFGASTSRAPRPSLRPRDAFLRPEVTVSEQVAGPAHEAITTDLFNGEVITGRAMSENGNFNTIFKVVLRNPRNGRYREAIFKPRKADDGNGWNRVPMEYVAYELNRMLGMDYVPPVAYRYGLKLAGYQFQEGALIHFVPNATVLGELAADALPLSRAAIASDSRVLNVLLQNTDAHAKNLLAGPHWADGVVRPVFIDFGASLRPGADISLTRATAAGNSDPVFWVRAVTLDRLRALDRVTLDRVIGPFTAADEISGILGRRDELVTQFDRLRRTYGDAAILLHE